MKKLDFVKNCFAIVLTAAVAIYLGGQLPSFVKKWRGPFTEGNYKVHVSQSDSKVTLYGTTTCQYCAAARAYLRDAGIPFRDINIDKSAVGAKAFKELNQAGVPVLVTADRLMVGFERNAYAEMTRHANK